MRRYTWRDVLTFLFNKWCTVWLEILNIFLNISAQLLLMEICQEAYVCTALACSLEDAEEPIIADFNHWWNIEGVWDEI